MKLSLLTASLVPFATPAKSFVPSSTVNPKSVLTSVSSKPSTSVRVDQNNFNNPRTPGSATHSLTQLQALSDNEIDDFEKVSDHPAFRACQMSKMLGKMRRPNRIQLNHLNSRATAGIQKIEKCISELKKGDPKRVDRAVKLFGEQVKIDLLTEKLQIIKESLQKVRTDGAYAIDTEIDECPTEAFTIVMDPPAKQEPFEIFLRGYFFNPPSILGQLYKSKEDYQIHTLIHEATHLALQEVDAELESGMPAYSPYYCMQLAKESPEKALTNADNWAWLAN